ncbi:type VI secretion system-associated FHA domain protein TagH [Sandarakinorhabdus sp. DWP1-3-1]|uniref:type VI secretion system-associated FHA domain protein TagH n=1 Tax=Sandarakinorhabdus sp. DWP1-3-1 TaxID=2804627 RepID=UPI003CEA3AE6
MWTFLLSRIGDAPGSYVDRRQFDGGQMKIGRNARSCDWALPDDQGHLSREHCTISAVGLDLFVIDTSTNGVMLNAPGQRIAPQVPVAVRVKDKLLLGDFVIEIATESAGAGVALTPAAAPPLPGGGSAGFDGMAQPDAWFTPAADPIWGTGPDRHAEVHDFLGHAMHDFLGPAPGSGGGGAPIDPAWGGPMSDAFSKPIMAAMTPVAADFGIPEDWAAPPRAAAPAAPAAADPFGDFAAPALAPAVDDPFAAFAPAAADPFGGPPPKAFGALADPFADAFGDAAPATMPDDPFALPGNAVSPDDDPFAMPAAAPPPQVFAATPASAARPAPAAAHGAAPAGDGWAAFCDGAGLDPDDLRLAPDAMRRLGVLYRQVVLGLSDLIQDRAAFKDEFRVERTQLSMGKNNPLKHLPPLDSAKLLLGDPLPGFMPADEALRTAFEDVKKHQLAMLAGVQHALNAVFERLSPAEIEALMAKASGAKRGLPFTRGINPWTVYQTVFEALRRDAVSNVNSVMSMAFRDGYEKFLKAGK